MRLSWDSLQQSLQNTTRRLTAARTSLKKSLVEVGHVAEKENLAPEQVVPAKAALEMAM